MWCVEGGGEEGCGDVASPVVALEVGVPRAGAASCLRCPERLSQVEGDLEKEGKIPGDRANFFNMPSAERGW